MANPEPPSEPKPLNKLRRLHGAYGMGNLAPSMNIPFPTHANLTPVELLTFLPNCTKSGDVINRFISNGATRPALWSIINTQRDLEVEWTLNSCGGTLYKTMRDAGYKDWTIRTHYKWHEKIKATWDSANLDVAGFKIPCQYTGRGKPALDFAFKDLAVEVRAMPQGYDALDLTRMVQYCVQRPDELWLYPRDYDQLLTVLGGPVVVQGDHTDEVAFQRWASTVPPLPRLGHVAITPQPQISTNPKKRKPLSTPGKGVSRMSITATEEIPAPETQSREATPVPVEKPEELFPGGATEPAKVRKRRGRPRKIARIEETAEEMKGEKRTKPKELYVQAPAEYIAPEYYAKEPPEEAVTSVYLTEGVDVEHGQNDAYAFCGPRSAPPYRSLHRIVQPHQVDMSGWAENLRWAYEQRACFSYSHRTECWNESPEHMEFIAKTRMKQVWASDELLWQLQAEEDEDLELEERMNDIESD